ncbi:MAG: hypothetical protein KF812_06775 [Fimbriimonadaceae bacterium]|nr:hypothetical protein [Fimbriimonadaceae bacterium]
MLVPVLAATPQDPPARAALYKDNDMGLQFEHPTNWQVTRTRLGAAFAIPLASGNQARVTLVRTNFRDTKEVWQELVRNIADAGRREVIDQSEETVLGVPMLLTRVRYGSSNGQMQMLQGLLFTRTTQKYNFQLEALESEMPEAEALWRGTWQSLRTTNNELPVAEGTPEEAVPPPPAIEPAVLVLTSRNQIDSEKKEIAVVPHDVTIEGASVKINLPEGWVVAPSSTSGYTLRKEGVIGTLVLDFVIGDRAFAPRVLGIRAKQSLDRFSTVTLRLDKTVGNNQSNATVSWVYRFGNAAGGPLAVMDAVGGEDFGVWAIRYEAPNAEAFTKDRAQLDQLMWVLGRQSA